jgi:hypothetical protein
MRTMNEIQNSASTTYDWLKNILNKSLEQLKEASTFWTMRRNEALGLLREAKLERYRDESYESYLKNLISYNDNLEMATILVQQLLGAVEQNPFPGEQMSVLSFASKAFPNVQFRWEGKGAYAKGKNAWRLVLGEYRFFRTCGNGWIGDYRVCFPVQVEWVDIEEAERKLCELCRDDWTVLASVVPGVCGMNANSKEYRQAKKVLESREWRWGTRREEGVPTKVVWAPGRVKPRGSADF